MESSRVERAATGAAVPIRFRDRRELAQQFAARAGLLSLEDRALVRAVFEEGVSPAEVGRMSGTSARSIRRRVKRLAVRIASARFVFVGRHFTAWPPSRRQVAEAVVLHGMSIRDAARRLRLSTYAVRAHVQMIEVMYEDAMRAA